MSVGVFVCVVFLCGWATLTQGKSTFLDTCKMIKALECHTFEQIDKCATNGVTYASRCDFAKAHCEDPDVHFLHVGSCDQPPTSAASTTPLPVGTTQATNELVQDVFCRAVAAMECAPDGNSVCGSDGVTYPSHCHFEKARCKNTLLSFSSNGDCP